MARARIDSVRELEREMGVLLRRIRRVMAERAQMVHPDLNGVAYSILIDLADSGPKRATAIAEQFSIDKGAVSRQVQQLADLELVDRQPDPADGRATMLELTALGRRRLDEVADERRADYAEKLSDWSAGELSAFTAQLRRYNINLG